MAEKPKPRSTANRVLVIQTAFIGDIVLTTSFLKELRTLLPEAEIFLLTTPAGAKLLEPNSWGIKTIAFDKRKSDRGFLGFWRKRKELLNLRPDLIFCLHRSMRSALLSAGLGAEVWGFKESAGAFLFQKKVARAKNAFEAEKNLDLLRAWSGSSKFSPYPKLEWSQREESEAQHLLAGQPSFVALAPSSVWATKRWPAEKFAQLALRLEQELGLPSVILGGDDAADRRVAEELLSAYEKLAQPSRARPINLVGKTSLGSLKSVLSKAKLVVSNDSSPLHMAIAVGTPVLGIFGPTTRELGFFPLAPEGKSAVAEVAGLSCRPCGLHGHQRCPQSHFRCMLDLQVDLVYAEAKKLLCR